MDITKELYLDKVKQDELEMVFLSFFGQGEQIKDSQYIYRKPSTETHFITIIFNKKEKIEKVISSPELSSTEIKNLRLKIYDQLINNQNIVIVQRACFSHRLVNNGYFKYKDLFQILPIPDYAPKIEAVIGSHPMLLEYKYISSTNNSVNATRSSKKFSDLILMLHFLSKGAIFSSPRYAEFAWVYNHMSDGDFSTSWKQLGYNYEGFSGKLANYSSTKKLKCFSTEETKYSNDLILLPDTAGLLDIILSPTSKIHEKFIRSLYWYNTANQIWKTSNSASYIFLLTSIECLLENIEKCECGAVATTSALERCEICKGPKYGISKNLKEFFEKYSNDIFKNLTAQEKSRIYNTRSRMVHGSGVYNRDLDASFVSYSQSLDDLFHRMVNKLISDSLYNYLILNKV